MQTADTGPNGRYYACAVLLIFDANSGDHINAVVATRITLKQCLITI